MSASTMIKTRAIRKVIKARPTLEGAGVHLNRVFGFGAEAVFDPFLLMDDFRSDTPAHYVKGFPWHPHRGSETITYGLQGDVEHGDSMGNKGVISAGDVQWGLCRPPELTHFCSIKVTQSLWQDLKCCEGPEACSVQEKPLDLM